MDKDEIITSIKEEAIKNKVPILQDISLDFIKLILRIKKPKKILEIGTAVGYSAINSITGEITGNILAESQEGVFITDVENVSNVDANMTNSKIENLSKTTLKSTVELSSTKVSK